MGGSAHLANRTSSQVGRVLEGGPPGLGNSIRLPPCPSPLDSGARRGRLCSPSVCLETLITLLCPSSGRVSAQQAWRHSGHCPVGASRPMCTGEAGGVRIWKVLLAASSAARGRVSGVLSALSHVYIKVWTFSLLPNAGR